MPKTQIDHDHDTQSRARMKQYSRIEKQGSPHGATKALQRRSVQRDGLARTKAYVKIERQRAD